MSIVKIRDIQVGEGIPKTCVPIVGERIEEIEQALETIRNCKNAPDLVEFRADWFEGAEDEKKIRQVLEKIRNALGNMVVLFTFRTLREGGERALRYEQYCKLLLAVAESGLVDAIDVETFSYLGTAQADTEAETTDAEVRKLIAQIREKGCVVIGSNHDFHATPQEKEMVRRLKEMKDMGVDIAKIAVMPENIQDVLQLLSATAQVSSDEEMCPVITMSMAKQGLISRLSGEVFGSVVTFASLGQASAPGQIALEELQKVLQIIHQ